MNTTNKEIKEKEERLLSFKQEVEGLRNIADAEEYARQLAHLFLGNGLSLQTILLMAIDFGQQHPQWIPVEERLPEPDPEYELRLSVECFITDGVNIETGYYSYIDKRWNYGSMPNITHWYIPTPPRKEEEK